MKQAGGQRMGRPLLTLSYMYQLWYDTSVTLNVLTYSQVAQLPKGLQGDLRDAS